MNSEILEPRCAPARRARAAVPGPQVAGTPAQTRACPHLPTTTSRNPGSADEGLSWQREPDLFKLDCSLGRGKKSQLESYTIWVDFGKSPAALPHQLPPAGPLGCPHPTQGALMHVLHGNPARGEGDSRVSRGQGLSGGQEAEPHKRAPKLRQCGTAAPGHCAREGVPPLPKVRRSRHGRLVPPGPACVFGLNYCCYCCG